MLQWWYFLCRETTHLFVFLLLLDFQPFLTFSLSNVYSFQKEKQPQVTSFFKTPTPSSKPIRRCPEPHTQRHPVLSVLQVHRESGGSGFIPSCLHRLFVCRDSQWNQR